MKKIIVIVPLVFLSCCVITKKFSNNFRIKDIYVYDYKNFIGSNFGAACLEFKNARLKNKISIKDPTILESVLNRCQSRRVIFGMTGGANAKHLFCDVVDLDGKMHEILISDNELINDYTTNCTYWISNKDDRIKISELTVKIYKL